MPPPRRRKRTHKPRTSTQEIAEFQLAGLAELTREKLTTRAAVRHRTVIGRTAQRKAMRKIKRTIKRHPGKSTRPKKPTTPPTPSQTRATRLRKENRRSSIIRRGADPTGEPFVCRGRLTQVVNVVISSRGRGMSRGVTDPFATPPEEQPQSTQDYFLSSRAIRRMAYNPNTQTLEIIFQTGYGYQFFKVPMSVWINLQQASSKGRFFMSQIYGHWTGPKGSMTYHPNYNYRRGFRL